jgi:hypothetical protein
LTVTRRTILTSGTFHHQGGHVVREIIIFKLRLGPDTDRFKELFLDVRSRMREIGVEPGRTWGSLTGEARDVIVEREFPSLAAYEVDDEAFHADASFVGQWRAMEELAVSMTVELWQGPVWD